MPNAALKNCKRGEECREQGLERLQRAALSSSRRVCCTLAGGQGEAEQQAKLQLPMRKAEEGALHDRGRYLVIRIIDVQLGAGGRICKAGVDAAAAREQDVQL